MRLLGVQTLKSLEMCLAGRPTGGGKKNGLDLAPERLREIADDGTHPLVKKATHNDDDNRVAASAGKESGAAESESDSEKKDRVWHAVKLRLSDEETVYLEKGVLNHPIWTAFKSFSFTPGPSDEMLIHRAFLAAKVLAVTEEDSDHVGSLGLHWPDVFRRRHEEFESYEPVGELKNVATRAGFATLDGIFALLIRLREYRNTDEWDIAKQLRDTLVQATQDYGHSFFLGDKGIELDVSTCNEYFDTWNYILNTCITHRPPFEVTKNLKQQALDKIKADFSRTQINRKGGGRPPKEPTMDGSGKVGGRWRRRIYIRACCLALHHQRSILGFVRVSQFTEWLVGERDYISEFIDRAALIQYVGGISRAEMMADAEWSKSRIEDLSRAQTLRVPVDKRHRIVRPSVDAETEYRVGQAWDYMYLIPTPPDELHAVATPPSPEESSITAEDEALADAMAKEEMVEMAFFDEDT